MNDEERLSQDLKERISAAQNKQKDASSDSSTQTAEIDGKAFGSAMRVGIELVSAIGIGTFIGYWIDKYFQTAPFGMIIMFFLGFAAGFLNIYKAQTKNYHKTGFAELTHPEKNGEKGADKTES